MHSGSREGNERTLMEHEKLWSYKRPFNRVGATRRTKQHSSSIRLQSEHWQSVWCRPDYWWPLPLLSPISFTTAPPTPPGCSELWPPIITEIKSRRWRKKRKKIWNKNCILQKTKISWWQTQRKLTGWSAQWPELSGATRNNHGGGAGGGAWWRGGPVLYTRCSCFFVSVRQNDTESQQRKK